MASPKPIRLKVNHGKLAVEVLGWLGEPVRSLYGEDPGFSVSAGESPNTVMIIWHNGGKAGYSDENMKKIADNLGRVYAKLESHGATPQWGTHPSNGTLRIFLTSSDVFRVYEQIDGSYVGPATATGVTDIAIGLYRDLAERALDADDVIAKRKYKRVRIATLRTKLQEMLDDPRLEHADPRYRELVQQALDNDKADTKERVRIDEMRAKLQEMLDI